MNNYPPGVTGNEPQITGEWPCSNCGAVLPEETDCPDCGRPMDWRDEGQGVWVCNHNDCGRALPGDVCPNGCPERDWDAERERRDEESLEDRYGD